MYLPIGSLFFNHKKIPCYFKVPCLKLCLNLPNIMIMTKLTEIEKNNNIPFSWVQASVSQQQGARIYHLIKKTVYL